MLDRGVRQSPAPPRALIQKGLTTSMHLRTRGVALLSVTAALAGGTLTTITARRRPPRPARAASIPGCSALADPSTLILCCTSATSVSRGAPPTAAATIHGQLIGALSTPTRPRPATCCAADRDRPDDARCRPRRTPAISTAALGTLTPAETGDLLAPATPAQLTTLLGASRAPSSPRALSRRRDRRPAGPAHRRQPHRVLGVLDHGAAADRARHPAARRAGLGRRRPHRRPDRRPAGHRQPRPSSPACSAPSPAPSSPTPSAPQPPRPATCSPRSPAATSPRSSACSTTSQLQTALGDPAARRAGLRRRRPDRPARSPSLLTAADPTQLTGLLARADPGAARRPARHAEPDAADHDRRRAHAGADHRPARRGRDGQRHHRAARPGDRAGRRHARRAAGRRAARAGHRAARRRPPGRSDEPRRPADARSTRCWARPA